METEKEPRQVVRFGIFDLDVRARSVHKSGIRIKLQGQPFDILVLLISRRGEVVTREELQRTLWPADTFVDFEHSVNTAVMRLRDALGDSAESPASSKPSRATAIGSSRRWNGNWTSNPNIAMSRLMTAR